MKRLVCFAAFLLAFAALSPAQVSNIGREVAIPRHLQDGEEYDIPVRKLIDFGKKLFTANWTIQEGAGRP